MASFLDGPVTFSDEKILGESLSFREGDGELVGPPVPAPWLQREPVNSFMKSNITCHLYHLFITDNNQSTPKSHSLPSDITIYGNLPRISLGQIPCQSCSRGCSGRSLFQELCPAKRRIHRWTVLTDTKTDGCKINLSLDQILISLIHITPP